MPEEYYDRYFPALKGRFKQTSDPDYYNCIAYAAGDSQRAWWPDSFPPGSRDYWPLPVENPPDERLETFIAAFVTIGYTVCDDGTHEPRYEKVAFYADAGLVRHAARQLQDGTWRSKLGLTDEDIEHPLDGLEGPYYGRIVAYMKRPILERETKVETAESSIWSRLLGLFDRLIRRRPNDPE